MMSDKTTKNDEVKVIGVGASAGGLEALQALLESGNPELDAAIVVIQHLAPDHATMTAELLDRHTRLQVHRVKDAVELQTGVVYVIEPNTFLTLEGNRLIVTERDSGARLHRPIDQFFVSLTEQRGLDAVGVVLSGTGSDGTDGARAIKEAGGFVVVQSPDTARFDGMPRSVISARCHDLCLPAEDILRRLEAIAKHEPPDPLNDSESLKHVLSVLSEKEDVDLASYREPTVRRRVGRRVALAQLDSVQEYVALLREDAAERLALVSDLFIGVTRFFRDPEGYSSLKETLQAIPETADPFRVWICGCSTGEEAYSVGMLLWQTLMDRNPHREFKIFATDVSEAAIRSASRGVFSSTAMSDVSPDLQARFFRRTDAGDFACESGLRNRIVFSHHDALRDPPFSRLDLVVCRNMLIYLEPEAQQQLLQGFSFSLRENGIMWLGPSESGADNANEFTVIDPKWRIFRNSSPRRGPRLDWKLRSPTQQEPRPSLGTISGMRRSELDWRRAHDAISSGFLPPHVVINSQFRVLFQHGKAIRQLLRFPEGELTTDVRHLVPKELRPVIESLVAEAGSSDAEASGISLEGIVSPITLRARRIIAGQDLTVLFVLEEEGPQARTEAQQLNLADIEADLQRRLQAMEQELQLSRESLNNTVEELESSNEELQATNEELLASNEELQSVNEELQSVNEELHTVNSEHQQKIVELGALNVDLDTLLATVDHGVLFLDAEMRVRRFNPRVQDFVAVRESDVGRPFGHFTHKLDEFPLLDLCARCLREKKMYEQVVPIKDGGRILLIRLTALVGDGVTPGVVISITDVTTVEHLRESHSRFLAALDNVDLPLALLSSEGILEYANRSLASLAGRDARYIVGNAAIDLIEEEFRSTWRQAVEQVGKGTSWEGYLRLARPDGSLSSEVVRLTPSVNAQGVVTGMVRLTLVNTRSSDGIDSGAFFFSSPVPRDSELGGVSLIVNQLATRGKVRERALTKLSPQDRRAVADALDSCDAQKPEPGESARLFAVAFQVRLGASQSYRVKAEFVSQGGMTVGHTRGVEWKWEDQKVAE